jgi:hypothetical protein
MPAGQFVDKVIREAINLYVNTLNINNASELVDYSKPAKVPPEALGWFFEPLD